MGQSDSIASLLQLRVATSGVFALIHVLYKLLLTFMTGHSGIIVRARPVQVRDAVDRQAESPSSGGDAHDTRTDLPSDSIEITEAEVLRLMEQRAKSMRSRRPN